MKSIKRKILFLSNYTSVTTNLNTFPSCSRRKSGFSGISLLFRNHVNSTSSLAPRNKTKRKTKIPENKYNNLPSITQSSVNGSPSIKFWDLICLVNLALASADFSCASSSGFFFGSTSSSFFFSGSAAGGASSAGAAAGAAFGLASSAGAAAAAFGLASSVYNKKNITFTLMMIMYF